MMSAGSIEATRELCTNLDHLIEFAGEILEAFWQQRRLPAIQPRHEARHQIPRRFSKGIIAWEEFSHRLVRKRT